MLFHTLIVHNRKVISVIVPVYNVEKYLIRCLDSINQQTCSPLEIILVDDGSTDSSGSICDSYIFDNHTKIVIHKENGGLISAWKTGVLHATSKYIGFVDSDDYIDKDMYILLLEKADETNADIVMCDHYHVYEESQSRNGLILEEGLYSKESYLKVLNNITPLLNNPYLSPARVNKIVKKEIIMRSLESLSETITSGEDNYSTTMWFLDSHSLALIDKPLYYYCHRPQSMSYSFNPALLDKYSTLIKDIINYNITRGNILQENKLLNLYNFYGFLWCSYVSGSNMKHSIKAKEIRRMKNYPEFKKALKFAEKGHFVRKLLYSLAVKYNLPIFILIALKFKSR